jgi:hypothetical protein
VTKKKKNSDFHKIADILSKGLSKQISQAMEKELDQMFQQEIYQFLVEHVSEEKVAEMLQKSSKRTIYLLEALKPESKEKIITAIMKSIDCTLKEEST